jgi:hypothetical protein
MIGVLVGGGVGGGVPGINVGDGSSGVVGVGVAVGVGVGERGVGEGVVTFPGHDHPPIPTPPAVDEVLTARTMGPVASKAYGCGPCDETKQTQEEKL